MINLENAKKLKKNTLAYELGERQQTDIMVNGVSVPMYAINRDLLLMKQSQGQTNVNVVSWDGLHTLPLADILSAIETRHNADLTTFQSLITQVDNAATVNEVMSVKWTSN